MKHRISTPNPRLKHKIGEYFKVYNIDEFRSSCINSKAMRICAHRIKKCNTAQVERCMQF